MPSEEWTTLVNSQQDRLRRLFGLTDDDDITL
jgi:hypothetical protein